MKIIESAARRFGTSLGAVVGLWLVCEWGVRLRFVFDTILWEVLR